MLSRFLLLLLAVGLALPSLHAAEKTAAAAPPGAPALDPDLTIYYICLLTKGSFSGVGMKEERIKTHAAQTAYINELAAKGKLLIAGPFADKSQWQGIYVFKCATLAEATSLALGDPEIRASRLKFEIHPWITEKGSIRDPAFPPGK